MKTHSELPKHPLPPVLPQQEQQRKHPQPPTVFVDEKQTWEYKIVSKDAADDPQLTGDELNSPGHDGWELTGVVTSSNTIHLYLKGSRR